LRIAFSQTRNFTVIAFTDANLYAILMTQRNVLKVTVRDRMVWLLSPACVYSGVASPEIWRGQNIWGG